MSASTPIAAAPPRVTSPLSTVDFQVRLQSRHAQSEAVEQVLLERKPVRRVLLSPAGVGMTLATLLSCGVAFGVFLYAYFGMASRRVSVKGRRLLADKIDGGSVSLDNLVIRRQRVSLLGIPLNRFVYVDYRDDRGKLRTLSISGQLYPRDQFDAFVPALAAAVR